MSAVAPLIRAAIDDNGVAQLTLADPEHRNALRLEMTRAPASAVADAVAEGARAIVVAADPPVFCAGGSLDDLLEPRAPLEESYAGFLAPARCPVPTIAAVAGACVGAGVNLPLACDVIVTTAAARFDPRWLDVGIHPGGGHLRRLSDRIGRQGAAALVLRGEVLDGTAQRDGELVQRTKATLDASLGIADDAAIAIELEAQRWSMGRPGFRAGVEKIRDQLAARADRR